jgi:hypothetical protein
MSSTPQTPPKMRCPTCGAKQAWSDSCRRCRSDLSLLHQALRCAQHLRRACLTALRHGRYDEAVQAAYRCCQWDSSQESRHLLAMAEFYCGRFATAVRLTQRHRQPEPR